MSRQLVLLARRYERAEDAARDYANAAKVPLQMGLTALAERLTDKGILAHGEDGWRITQKPPERPKRSGS